MRATPRVLMLVENNAYPLDFRVRREAIALRDAGYSVSVVAPRGKGERWAEHVDGIHVYRFPAPPGGSGVLGYGAEFLLATLSILLLTAYIALRRGVDVIHAGNPPDTLFVVAGLFKVAGVRFVFDQHDLSPETYLARFASARRGAVYSALQLMERFSYCLADVVIAPNETYKQVAMARGHKGPEQVFVVRNGPPLSYQPLPPEPDIVARAPYRIGYVGTINPQDGMDRLVKAVSHMVHTLGRRDFVAVVIGDGDALQSAQELAAALGVDPFMHFTGRLGEEATRRHLSAADVCVQPDPWCALNDASTMNKLMEYMALGKPTVAFDLTETRCSAGDAALYAPANDEAAFARHICWLLDHPDERHRMGAIGRERVTRALAWEYSVPELVRAYRDGLCVCPR